MSGRGRARATYCVRADGGRYAEAFRDGGYAAIGWMPNEDLSGIARDDAATLSSAYDSSNPGEGKLRRGHSISQINQFLWDIGTGDVIVTPMDPPERLLVGVVSSDYYREVTPNCPYPHRRAVEWLDETVSRSSFSVPVQGVLRVPRTVFRVRPPDELLKACGLEAPESKPVERVEKGLHALVLERLLQLDADEFEILVAELLTALGFEAEKTGRAGDGGVDVEGALHVHGFASVDLRVQVKRYKVASNVGPKAIKEFRASVPDKAQGAFVATSGYTEKARQEAEREGFKRIGLIDGGQLVDILAEEYDRLPQEMREKLGLRRALVVG